MRKKSVNALRNLDPTVNALRISDPTVHARVNVAAEVGQLAGASKTGGTTGIMKGEMIEGTTAEMSDSTTRETKDGPTETTSRDLASPHRNQSKSRRSSTVKTLMLSPRFDLTVTTKSLLFL